MRTSKLNEQQTLILRDYLSSVDSEGINPKAVEELVVGKSFYSRFAGKSATLEVDLAHSKTKNGTPIFTDSYNEGERATSKPMWNYLLGNFARNGVSKEGGALATMLIEKSNRDPAIADTNAIINVKEPRKDSKELGAMGIISFYDSAGSVLEAAIKHGTNPNKSSALENAVISNNDRNAKILLEGGANPNNLSKAYGNVSISVSNSFKEARELEENINNSFISEDNDSIIDNINTNLMQGYELNLYKTFASRVGLMGSIAKREGEQDRLERITGVLDKVLSNEENQDNLWKEIEVVANHQNNGGYSFLMEYFSEKMVERYAQDGELEKKSEPIRSYTPPSDLDSGKEARIDIPVKEQLKQPLIATSRRKGWTDAVTSVLPASMSK